MQSKLGLYKQLAAPVLSILGIDTKYAIQVLNIFSFVDLRSNIFFFVVVIDFGSHLYYLRV